MLSDPTYSSICSAAPNCASGQYRATSGANTGTCQNEPTCTAPQVLNTTTHTCDTPPVTCTPPETPDGFGGCAVTECTSQQILNTTSGACQTPPTCGSTEKYNNATNTCFLSTLQCPEHSHASSGNDQCLPDAPLACPTGQHDDGTYTCIANDATRCSTNQYDGEINGQKACINKPNLDTAQKAAQDNAAATQAAENAALQDRLEYYSARDAYLSAQAASDADPLDTAKAAAAASALGTMQTKESELATSESTAQTAQSNQQKAEQSYQSETTRSIDRNTSDISAKQDTTNATLSSIDTTLKQTGSLGTGDMTTGIDSLGSTASNALDNSSEVTQTGSWFDAVPTMPEPGGCVTIPMNFKALQYTLDPCDKLAAFRDMFAYFLYIATTIFIIRIAVRQ